MALYKMGLLQTCPGLETWPDSLSLMLLRQREFDPVGDGAVVLFLGQESLGALTLEILGIQLAAFDIDLEELNKALDELQLVRYLFRFVARQWQADVVKDVGGASLAFYLADHQQAFKLATFVIALLAIQNNEVVLTLRYGLVFLDVVEIVDGQIDKAHSLLLLFRWFVV